MLCALVCALAVLGTALGAPSEEWITAWITAPLSESPGAETPALSDATLRQTIRVTAAGRAVRIRLGNYFGAEPLGIGGGRIAVQSPGSSSLEWRQLRFSGAESVSVPAGGAMESDPVQQSVSQLDRLVVELYFTALPKKLTVHTAARSNSYVAPGNALTSPAGVGSSGRSFTRWYFLCGVDVLDADGSAVVVLGDSIADGYGVAPDTYGRWADAVAVRLRDSGRHHVAVLNAGIGGNRLLRDGLGPRALTRLDRDVFAQHGVRAVIVSMGINDIGTRVDARRKQQPYASRDDIIGALRQIAVRARERGLRVYGATLTPYAGAGFYWSEDGEADRQAVNEWIRRSGEFDAVIDFDAAIRDPERPDRLARRFDSGDHLHPSPEGYAEMGRFVDLSLFSGKAHDSPRP